MEGREGISYPKLYLEATEVVFVTKQILLQPGLHR